MTSFKFYLVVVVASAARSASAADLEIVSPLAACGADDWYFHEGHCYYVAMDPTGADTMGWRDAAEFCSGVAAADFPGAHLADVLDLDEQVFLDAVIQILVGFTKP